MQKKKLITILSLLIILILFVFSWQTVGNKDNFVAQKIKSFIPESLKKNLKNTIFALPYIIEKNKEQDKKIKKFTQRIAILEAQVFNLENQGSLKTISNKEIISDNGEKFNLRILKLPLPQHEEWGLKPVAYLENHSNNIFFSSGDGRFFYINIDEKKIEDSEKLNQIQTNIKDYILDKKFYEPFVLSIKDIFIKNENIFFTYGNVKDNCLILKVAYSKLDYKYLEFKDYFSHKECDDSFDVMNYQHIGGRLFSYFNDSLLLSTGDMGHENLSDTESSIFGKIINIKDNKNNFNIISKGHRNPQGLYYDKIRNLILNTEHGPTGGDEVNINDLKGKTKHFGWPFASYAIDDEIKYKDSHAKYGYVEPTLNFTPSIGISQIIKVPEDFFSEQRKKNRYFVTSLGWDYQIDEGDNTIHIIDLDDNQKIIGKDKLKVFQRMRDIIYVENINSFVLSLESIPALGILTKI